jgi:hypothetical protein
MILHAAFHVSKKVNGACVIKDQAISNHLGESVFSNDRLATPVNHNQNGISGTEVHAHLKTTIRRR